MESEEDEIKSKQASKKDRTLLDNSGSETWVLTNPFNFGPILSKNRLLPPIKPHPFYRLILISFFIIASLGYAHIKLQQELRDANVAQEKAQYIY